MVDLVKAPGQFARAFNSFSTQRKVFAGLAVLLTIGVLIAMIIWANRVDYKLLYTGLSAEDSGAVVNSLRSKKVPYRVAEDGSTIMVPADKVYELRMQMASEGIPQGSGVGYEIFDRQGMGVTDFVQKVNLQRALQGELARTITQFREVKQARVHLTMPKESLFRDQEEKPRASVVLTLHSGKTLRDNQIQGITHLVSSSVQGLASEDVILVDSHGTLLAGGQERAKYAGMTASQQEIQKSTEWEIESKIVSMLGSVLGPGKVSAKVSVDMDFTQIEQTEESFDPDKTAVRSEQRTQEKSSGRQPGQAGVPGVMSNTPDLQEAAAGAAGKSTDYNKSDETVNYEVSRVTKRTINQIGAIDRLSAAVLIDGIYAMEATDGKETRVYKARSEEEMKKYDALVKQAVGYNKERGDSVEVVNVQFHEMPLEEETGFERLLRQVNLQSIISYVVTAGLFALFLVFGLRPLLRLLGRAVEQAEALPQIAEARKGIEGAAAELPAGVMSDDGLRVSGRHTNLVEFAKKNPRLFAQYLKTWLAE